MLTHIWLFVSGWLVVSVNVTVQLGIFLSCPLFRCSLASAEFSCPTGVLFLGMGKGRDLSLY